MKKITVFLLAILISLSSNISFAGEIDTKVVDERWGKPTFVYGESLDKSQIRKTKGLLNIEDDDNIKSVMVTYNDLLKYIGGDDSNPGSMISSVLVKKENKNKGIKVNITTPKNITLITEKQYENAAITAGVKDCTIMVAAVRPVTGESALTGVFKAFESNGEKLQSDRIKVAQEELEVVSDINKENKDKSDFNRDKLNDVIVVIKDNIANININNNGQAPTLEEIKKIVNDAIKENNLENVITEDQKQELVNFFEKYSNVKSIDSKDIKDELSNISGKVIEGAKDIYKKAEDAGIIDKIINFFSSIIKLIADSFDSNK
ncbi:DUF1002 domain-containing protein [Finegoldia magna]|uniref:DUF1002 domain-containing protein n=1 Tax=Finegoldia magna TaxID=1260 RepID=UPI000D710518|nr:DUF1002 domain-containing protein [Finegoldia magna]MCC3311043.1 DUF1002 domain-containing protein [Finegoldia magna]PWV50901.1 uncharacterized protein YpuA (DUF1002 family) [Finegoldia magna]